MLLICSKTAVEFTTSGFPNFKIRSEHPLFSAPYDTLLEIAKDWRQGKLSESECRVLFVALLDSTELVVWHTNEAGITTAAQPTDITVQRYMERLLFTSNWKHSIGNRIPLNQIAINHASCTLDNIGNWLDNWNSTQREFTSSMHLQSMRITISAAQEKLIKLLQLNKQDSDLFLKHLSKWFMVASNAPKALWDYWTDLFLMKQPEIWNASTVDLDELKEHCEHNIPMNSSYAMYAYRHICAQLQEASEGVLGAIVGSGPIYTIISDPVEQANLAILSEQAPPVEPLQQNYNTVVEYLKARAAWRIKLRQIAAFKAQQATLPINSDTGEFSDDAC